MRINVGVRRTPEETGASKALTTRLGITLLFLPSYSPHLHLIKHLWKFRKSRALDGLPTTHAEQWNTLVTLNFPADMAARGRIEHRLDRVTKPGDETLNFDRAIRID
jgi:transposase